MRASAREAAASKPACHFNRSTTPFRRAAQVAENRTPPVGGSGFSHDRTQEDGVRPWKNKDLPLVNDMAWRLHGCAHNIR